MHSNLESCFFGGLGLCWGRCPPVPPFTQSSSPSSCSVDKATSFLPKVFVLLWLPPGRLQSSRRKSKISALITAGTYSLQCFRKQNSFFSSRFLWHTISLPPPSVLSIPHHLPLRQQQQLKYICLKLMNFMSQGLSFVCHFQGLERERRNYSHWSEFL